MTLVAELGQVSVYIFSEKGKQDFGRSSNAHFTDRVHARVTLYHALGLPVSHSMSLSSEPKIYLFFAIAIHNEVERR